MIEERNFIPRRIRRRKRLGKPFQKHKHTLRDHRGIVAKGPDNMPDIRIVKQKRLWRWLGDKAGLRHYRLCKCSGVVCWMLRQEQIYMLHFGSFPKTILDESNACNP